jgi:SOS-response transcriptional repressor LexA
VVKKPVSIQAERVYYAVLYLEERLGYRPSQQEIANQASFRSKGSANKYIKELEVAGWIVRDYLGLNTLRPTDKMS